MQNRRHNTDATPQDVIEYILSFICPSTAKSINKISHSIFKDVDRVNAIRQWFPLQLAHLLYSEKVIDLGERIGYTGYIDFIRKNDLPPALRGFGVDIFRRPFVTFYAKNGIVTFFQRYTDKRSKWTFGGHGDTILSPGTVVHFTDEPDPQVMGRFLRLWEESKQSIHEII